MGSLMSQLTPFDVLIATEFGSLHETTRLRELFAAYAADLFNVSARELTEREVQAAYRAFLPFMLDEVGIAERQYVLPADWAIAMVSDNPGFIADDKERGWYLNWIGYLVAQGGANLYSLQAEKVGPVFLSAVVDVHFPGVLNYVTPAEFTTDDGSRLYWCQTINLQFQGHD